MIKMIRQVRIRQHVSPIWRITDNKREFMASRKYPLLGNFHIFRERASHDIKRQSPPIRETLDSPEDALKAPTNRHFPPISGNLWLVRKLEEALARRFKRREVKFLSVASSHFLFGVFHKPPEASISNYTAIVGEYPLRPHSTPYQALFPI